MGKELLAHTHSCVVYNEPQNSVIFRSSVQRGRQRNLSAFIGKLNGVAQDINQHLLQLHGIANIVIIQHRVQDAFIVHSPGSGLGIADGIDAVKEFIRGDLLAL